MGQVHHPNDVVLACGVALVALEHQRHHAGLFRAERAFEAAPLATAREVDVGVELVIMGVGGVVGLPSIRQRTAIMVTCGPRSRLTSRKPALDAVGGGGWHCC